MQSVYGFNGSILLNTPNIPSGIGASFVPNPIAIPAWGKAESALTLTIGKGLPVSVYSFTIVARTTPIAYETKTITVQLYVSTSNGCLIATATYGSELAPEVKFLRDFRDNKILRTIAGSSFMVVFNDWYYSFSPIVAEYEYTHAGLRDALKVTLYPLIGTLHVAEIVFSAFAFQPEVAALLAGIVAGLGLGFIYLSVPITIATIRLFDPQRRRTGRNVRWTAVTFGLLLGGFMISEIMTLPALMMFVSSIIVLFALTMGALLPTILLSRNKK